MVNETWQIPDSDQSCNLSHFYLIEYAHKLLIITMLWPQGIAVMSFESEEGNALQVGPKCQAPLSGQMDFTQKA
jgi:hypothetical protein